MPTTIKQLVEEVALSATTIKKVKWGTPIDCKKEGIYIVSLSEDAESNKTMEMPPISTDILKEWIEKLDYFTLDKQTVKNVTTIIKRLSEFWIPDESILYIGKAPLRKSGGGIGNRVQEYYDTAIGERAPHAGGHWIKALENLNELHVFYIECKEPDMVESKMLSNFGKRVSQSTKDRLSAKGPILPFANLEDGNKKKKKHGLGHMKKEK